MDINWNYTINYNLSMRNNSVRKKIFCQIPVLLLILAISVPMVTSPVSSNILFSSSSSIQVNQLVYAEEEGNDSSGGDSSGGDSSGGDSSGGDSSGGDSSGGDQSSSSTTTADPALASSTTTADPA